MGNTAEFTRGGGGGFTAGSGGGTFDPLVPTDGTQNLTGSLAVSAAATIGTTLGVTGAATLSSTLAVTGAATLSSTLGVTGATTLSSTLAVTGASTYAGALTVTVDDATTNAVTDLLTLAHTTSGTAAAGIGAGILFTSEDTAGNAENVARISGVLSTATNASEASALVFQARTGGAVLADIARIGAAGMAVGVGIQSSMLAGPAAGVGLAVMALSTNNAMIQVTNVTSGVTASDGLSIMYSGTSGAGVARINQRETGTLIFATADTDRWQFNSTGDFEALSGRYIEMREMTAPATPSADRVRIYAVDNGGKTQLMAIFPSGAAQQLAIEP